MAYITREDGVHFVIPSYRDVITAKQKSLLKKEILLLSQNYGEYITMQRKSAAQYEIAFSTDAGYLLGESIWHYFKRPMDMIYCEAIPNTNEAILVIVKAGSVYLDGSFPMESIPEELVIFLTQQNNFEIYTYGDVPITQIPEEGKFSFETASVKSFNVLDKPVFPTLPLMKMYQLQLVPVVLKEQGIGVFPTKQVVTVAVVLVVGYFIYAYITAPTPIIETGIVSKPKAAANPYKDFMTMLSSPSPQDAIDQYLDALSKFLKMPGWTISSIQYMNGIVVAPVLSYGGKLEDLLLWGKDNNVNIEIRREGVFASMMLNLQNRNPPANIYPMDQIIAKLIDGIATVYPGNHLTLSEYTRKGQYNDVRFTLTLDETSPMLLDLIKAKLNELPVVVQNITTSFTSGKISSSITFEVLGS